MSLHDGPADHVGPRPRRDAMASHADAGKNRATHGARTRQTQRERRGDPGTPGARMAYPRAALDQGRPAPLERGSGTSARQGGPAPRAVCGRKGTRPPPQRRSRRINGGDDKRRHGHPRVALGQGRQAPLERGPACLWPQTRHPHTPTCTPGIAANIMQARRRGGYDEGSACVHTPTRMHTYIHTHVCMYAYIYTRIHVYTPREKERELPHANGHVHANAHSCAHAEESREGQRLDAERERGKPEIRRRQRILTATAERPAVHTHAHAETLARGEPREEYTRRSGAH